MKKFRKLLMSSIAFIALAVFLAPNGQAAYAKNAGDDATAEATKTTAKVSHKKTADSSKEGTTAATQKKTGTTIKNFKKTSPRMSGGFVASREGDSYHVASCGYVKKIKPENLIQFSSASEATKVGYAPCKVCLKSS